MRRKTAVPILGAAAFAVGALSSATAQNLYSENVVGYVNVPIQHGFQILGNPLNAPDNTVNGLFSGGSNGLYNGPWEGVSIYTWSGFGFLTDHLDSYGAGWPNPYLLLNPGTGFFVSNPGPTFTNTFVGTVVQGGATNTIPNHFSLQSSTWPVGTNVVQLGLNAGSGDTIYTWGGSGFLTYHLDSYGAGWGSPPPPAPQADPVNGPVIGIGQGFFYNNIQGAPFNWVQNFTVQ